MEKVLEISHLSKKFGQQYALNDVNLTIHQRRRLWPDR